MHVVELTDQNQAVWEDLIKASENFRMTNPGQSLMMRFCLVF